ncbi:hypothetical protein [Parasediminibacterium sp. JCM 36343]|uniref:hypothetical protein n=1 Tax=Parasediminibacterium sp. JCM 36343 TaxID=3374279 RepID=UPI00397BD03B
MKNVANDILAEQQNIKQVKNLVWVYFYLLIFEGALRKWVFPSLASPLLLAREPIAMLLIYLSFKSKVYTNPISVLVVWSATILSFFLTIYFGHGNLLVDVYGLRIFLLHYPLIFIIAHYLNKDDVLQIGKTILWLNIAMTILVAMQLFSPQSAWVNRGVGGEEGSGFSGSGHFFRVPGTFSFTNGLSMFYGFAGAFIFYFWLDSKFIKENRLLLIASTVALIAAVPLSISRAVFFQLVVSFIFLLLYSLKQPKLIGKLLLGLGVFALLIFILNFFTFFQIATIAFSDRFQNANRIEGGVQGVFVDRFLGGMWGAITNQNTSLAGLGLGMGTNAGARLMSAKGFLISEGEWGRLIGEMGIFLGMVIILARCALTVNILQKSWALLKENEPLAWLLISTSGLLLLQGQWAQPTSLGFSVFGAGINMAAMNKSKLY